MHFEKSLFQVHEKNENLEAISRYRYRRMEPFVNGLLCCLNVYRLGRFASKLAA